MQMAIHYNRGEIQQAREVQSAGLRILLATFFIVNAFLLLIFICPITYWLQLTITENEAQLTLYILGCQIISGMVFGFFSGSYMSIGLAHRGVNFDNGCRLLVVVLQLGLVMMSARFYYIAGAQLVATLLGSIVLIIDFSRLAPDLRPTLRYWKKGSLVEILKPSAHYALLYSSNVLAYQLPTLLMQRILGPGAVVVYSLTRTIYSMSRRILYLLTNSIGPEITMAVGRRDWHRLHRLYEFSERIILLMTLPITFGTMLATPLLLSLWLHKIDLYDPTVCILLGITVSILGIKEHKYQFQFSSNQVQSISYMTLFAYGAQLLIAAPVMEWFGLNGYIALWCLNETLQLFYMMHLNGKLFGNDFKIDRVPVYLLFMCLLGGAALVYWPMYHMADIPVVWQAVLALGVGVVTLALSYRLFRVEEVRAFLWKKPGVPLAGEAPYRVAEEGTQARVGPGD